jgi:hypothetical protein
MNNKKNIDDLLNSFVDGELSARKHTEVKRLAEHDASVAKRIGQIQTLRSLVGTVPRVEVPDDLSGRLRELAQRKTRVNERASVPVVKRHLRYAILRKTLSLAAMVGLVLVLSIVVYTIVVPSGTTPGWNPPVTTQVSAEPLPIGGRLEFACTALSAVNMSVNRAIRMNGLMDYTEERGSSDEKTYRIRCNQQALCLLLDDIKLIWPQFRESTMYLNTARISAPLVVNAITASQTISVFKQDSLMGSLDTARQVAVQNSVDKLSPSNTMIALSSQQLENTLTPPMSMLASRNADRDRGRDYTPAADDALMDLTIILTLKK